MTALTFLAALGLLLLLGLFVVLGRRQRHSANVHGPYIDRQCPYCKEWVRWELEICPSCHLRFYDPVIHGAAASASSPEDQPQAETASDLSVSSTNR